MPTPYPFVSGATLLASQMNSLSQLPTVSITSNSTAVATHAYSRVIANGSAITYTIPNSVFEAGQVIEFHNINSTVCTIAAGAGVTLNGAAGLTVAQYQSARIYATSASSFILFESTVRPGLEFISSTTIGSGVSTVTVSNAFSSTYDNYFITVSGGAGSTSSFFKLTLGATTSGYYYAGYFTANNYASTLTGLGEANIGYFPAGETNTNSLSAAFHIYQPNLAKVTLWSIHQPAARTTGYAQNYSGFLNDTTQYTAFTLAPNAGTITGGTICVYGYRN